MDANRRLDDDDLLAPSLTAHDDAVGFDRPWSPNLLVVIGAFFGLLPMGMLLAENFRRLGKPRAYLPTLLGTLAAGVAMVSLAGYAHVYGIPGWYEVGNQDHRRTARLAHQALAIAVGLAIAHRQRPRWELHLGHGGQGGPLWKAALGTIALAFVIQFAVAAPFAWLKAQGGGP